MNTLHSTEIDLINLNSPERIRNPLYRTSPTFTAIELAAVAIKFSQIERVPRYCENNRENDAEHSYMLGLVATELAVQLYPGRFNLGLVTQFCNVHDLPELKTGDVPTFHFHPEDMETKRRQEHERLNELLDELPPYHAWLLYEYEQQKKAEAVFTRGVDKNLPVIVDLLGAGKKVMAEDYGVTTIEQLIESHTKLHSRIADSFKQFPELVEMHAELCQLFQVDFATTP